MGCAQVNWQSRAVDGGRQEGACLRLERTDASRAGRHAAAQMSYGATEPTRHAHHNSGLAHQRPAWRTTQDTHRCARTAAAVALRTSIYSRLPYVEAHRHADQRVKSAIMITHKFLTSDLRSMRFLTSDLKDLYFLTSDLRSRAEGLKDSKSMDGHFDMLSSGKHAMINEPALSAAKGLS